MKHRIALIGAALLAACAGGDGAVAPPDNQVASVVVAAPAVSVGVGATLTATATPVNRRGKPVVGTPITWSSGAPTVASVSSSGVITGRAEGTAVIRAVAGGTFGELSISVTRDYCTSPLSLAVGEVRVLSGASAVSCVTLAASPSSSDYLFVVANGSTTQDDLGSYFVSASDGARASAAASPSLAGAIGGQGAAPSLQDAFEARLRAREAATFAGRRPADLQRASGRPLVRMSIAAGATAAVGDTLTYRVPDASGSDLCKQYATVRAVVRAVGSRAQIVEDVSAPAGGFTASDYQAIAAEYDRLIYPTDSAWFGAPTDINGDGHITILYTPAVNRLTPANSASFVAGFFWGGDLLGRSIPSRGWSCPASNEQELFYVLSPDPNGTVNGNSRTTTDVRQGTRGTIAHEMQHMINQGIRQANPAAGVETPWMNEALSHLAEEVVGRAAIGAGDWQRLSFATINANPADYQAFFRQNLARFRTWMQHPDTASPVSAKAASQLAPRGAAWALVRYATDRYSRGDARTFVRQLVAGPETDVSNLVARAGSPFDDVLSGFLIANFATGLGVPALAARWTYASWDLRDAMGGVSGGSFPLLVTPLPAQLATQSLAGSGNYFRLARPAGAPAATFRTQQSASGGAPFGTARLYVVRLG